MMDQEHRAWGVVGDVIGDRSTQYPAQGALVMGADHDQVDLFGFGHGNYLVAGITGLHSDLGPKPESVQNLSQAASSLLSRSLVGFFECLLRDQHWIGRIPASGEGGRYSVLDRQKEILVVGAKQRERFLDGLAIELGARGGHQNPGHERHLRRWFHP
jgi:hypothetical protein